MTYLSQLKTYLKRRTFELNRKPTHTSKRVAFVLKVKMTELTRLNKKVQYYKMILTTSYYEVIPKYFRILN